MIRIKSDGTARGTHVEMPDGAQLQGIERIEMLPIEPDGIVRARLTFMFVELDVAAEIA